MSSSIQQRLLRPRSRSTSRTRRPRTVSVYVEKEPAPVPEGCVCDRPYGTVFCKSCGWMYREGRVKTACPIHTRTLYLLDIEMCPRCRAYPPTLTELTT